MRNQNEQQQSSTFYPLMLRVFCILLTCIFLLDLILSAQIAPSLYLANQFSNTVMRYQVWRFFTGWIYQENFFIFVIIMLQLVPIMHKFQCKNGSAVLLNDVVINYAAYSYFIMVFFTIFYFGTAIIVSRFYPQKIPQIPQFQGKQLPYSQWPIPSWYFTPGLLFLHLNILYKYCYYNSEIQIKKSLCMAWYFKSSDNQNQSQQKMKLKYYPIITYGIVVIVSGLIYLLSSSTNNMFVSVFRIDGLIGLLLSAIQCRCMKGGMLHFTDDSYTDKQKYLSYIYCTESSLWVQCNPESLVLNSRDTVCSRQFYQNLGDWKIGSTWKQFEHLKKSSKMMEQQQSTNFVGKPAYLDEN